MNHLTVGDRQHNALLAAIQLWQKISLEHPELMTPDILKTAAGDDGEPLSYDQMNELCRGINDGVNCLNAEFVAMVDGFHKLANHLDAHQVHPAIVEGYDGVALYLNAVTTAGLACGDLVAVEVDETETVDGAV